MVTSPRGRSRRFLDRGAVSEGEIETSVLMQGAHAALREVEGLLRESGIASEIVRPPEGCGSG